MSQPDAGQHNRPPISTRPSFAALSDSLEAVPMNPSARRRHTKYTASLSQKQASRQNAGHGRWLIKRPLESYTPPKTLTQFTENLSHSYFPIHLTPRTSSRLHGETHTLPSHLCLSCNQRHLIELSRVKSVPTSKNFSFLWYSISRPHHIVYVKRSPNQVQVPRIGPGIQGSVPVSMSLLPRGQEFSSPVRNPVVRTCLLSFSEVPWRSDQTRSVNRQIEKELFSHTFSSNFLLVALSKRSLDGLERVQLHYLSSSNEQVS
jgi:hypothetical protein